MARSRKRRSDALPAQRGAGGAEQWSATASVVRNGRDEAAPDHAPAPQDVEREASLGADDERPGGAESSATVGGMGAPINDDSQDELDDQLDDDFDDGEEQLEDRGGGRGGGGGRRGRRGGGGDSGGDSGGGGAIVPARPSTPTLWIGARVLQFLQGCWRELQRVQWPDRPQVMQATGVVIGFVIVAGVFLGVSDFLATKLVNFILK